MTALQGIRVLDISNFFAAPLVSAHLGDFGAEVIKVEAPQGDPYRGTRLWPVIARNKKSVTLDLSTPAGCDALRVLIAHADVIVENYSTDYLASRGLDWASLHTLNPKLIMLSLSCFGGNGPYAGHPGNGTMGEAFSGFTHMTGPEDGPPVLPSVALGDAVGALSAAFGVMMALYTRDVRNGSGQRIDATLYEPILQIMAQTIARWQPGATPHRLSNRMAESYLRNVFPTADNRYLLIALSTKRQLQKFLSMIGAAPDADVESSASNWTRQLTRDKALAACQDQGILAASVNDMDDLLADPHITHRGNLLQFDDPGLGSVMLPSPTPSLAETPGSINWISSPVGAHNKEILCDLAGLDESVFQTTEQPSK